MQPFSYAGLRAIHDQKVEQALAEHRFDAERKAPRPRRFQMVKKFFARLALACLLAGRSRLVKHQSTAPLSE